MPPDTIAGLSALTGPPGAASPGKAAEPPVSRTVSAAVFASLLIQSSPPDLKLAALKTDAAPTVKLGFAAKQQISKDPKTLATLRTMDTLPALSFSATGAAPQASELPFLNAPPHKSPADDSKADAVKTSAATPDTAAAMLNSVLNSVLNVMPIAMPAPVQAMLLPVSASALLTAQKTLSAAPPVPTAAAAPLAPPSAPASLSATVPLSTPLPSLVRPQLTPTFEPATDSSPTPSGVSLPHTWTLPVPASAQNLSPVLTRPTASVPPLVGAAVPGPAIPEPAKSAAGSALTAAVPSTPQPAQAARTSPPAVPPAALPGQAVPQGSAPLQAQAAPQRAALPLIANPASPILSLVSPILASPLLASFTAASVLAEPAAVPAALPPAKSTGKPGQTTLKPALQNADINTRTSPLEPPAAALKTAASAVVLATTPALASDSQSQAPDSKKPLKPEDALASKTLLAAQAVPLEAQGTPGSKPLSAADHTAMVRQVADGVEAMPLPAKPGGVEQMSLQLHPKDWGSLQVSVAVTPGQEPGAAKTVTAHIVAETPQVKAALQSQTGALHQALRASGLNLEHLTVSVKPASEIVKPAAQSASAGFSGGFLGGQGQPNTGGSSAHPAQTAPSSQFAGTQLGTSAGSSQNGRQGQPPAPTFTPAQAEAEETAPVRQSARLSGRIDTHA